MWQPDPDVVSEKEILGRRTFGDNITKPDGQFRMTVFLDTRYDEDLSLDRMGMKTVDPEVTVFLTPQCHAHGKTQSKRFAGWAAIRKKVLTGLDVRPNAQLETADHPANPYHADLSRNGYRDRRQAETLAFRLVLHAQDLGLVAPAS